MTSRAQPRQRFPLNGLAAQSRIAYQTALLLRHEIRPGLFVFAGAGGAVTAVAGAETVVLRTIEGRVLPLIAANLTASEIIAAAPTAEFDARWGTGYVTGPHFTRMVLAGLGITEMPARSCVSNVTKFSKPEIVA